MTHLVHCGNNQDLNLGELKIFFSPFFELVCYAFPIKVCILNQLQLQRSPYQKLKVYL